MGAVHRGKLVDQLDRESHLDALLRAPATAGRSSPGRRFDRLDPLGPALGGILDARRIQGEAAHRAFLSAVYSLGLAAFLITALAFSATTTASP